MPWHNFRPIGNKPKHWPISWDLRRISQRERFVVFETINMSANFRWPNSSQIVSQWGDNSGVTCHWGLEQLGHRLRDWLGANNQMPLARCTRPQWPQWPPRLGTYTTMPPPPPPSLRHWWAPLPAVDVISYFFIYTFALFVRFNSLSVSVWFQFQLPFFLLTLSLSSSLSLFVFALNFIFLAFCYCLPVSSIKVKATDTRRGTCSPT